MRCFVAVDLPDAVRDALEDVQGHLRAGRLSDPETFHVTLAFLGEQDTATLEELHDRLDRVRQPAFEVQPRGLGTFGGRTPRVLWAGLAHAPGLTLLHERTRGAARLAGIDLPRERFRPHVTLARFPDRLEPGELEKIRVFLERFERYAAPVFEVTGFTLFRSILGPDGAVHEPLAEYRLDGRDPDLFDQQKR